MDNNEYVYVVFRCHEAMFDADERTYLDIILKTEEEAKKYIKANTNKKDKYTGFKYEKIKIGKCADIYLPNLFYN